MKEMKSCTIDSVAAKECRPPRGGVSIMSPGGPILDVQSTCT
jgi:hypothetical protein